MWVDGDIIASLLVPSSLLVVLLVFFTFWWQHKYWQVIWQLNGWRGIALQPLMWLLLLLFLDPKSILDITRRVRRHCPRPLAIYVIWWNCVLLYCDDPATMECVLNAPECVDKTFMQDGFFARKGLLHARGQKWKIRRKQLNPAFSHNLLLNFFDTFNLAGDQLVEKLTDTLHAAGGRGGGGDGVSDGDGDGVCGAALMAFKDLEDLLSRAVLEVSCQTTMGTTTNFLAQDSQNIARTYKKLMDISAMKIIKPWLQIDWLFRLLAPKDYVEQGECNKLVEQFVNNIVESKHREWLARQEPRTASTITETPTTKAADQRTDNDNASFDQGHNAVERGGNKDVGHGGGGGDKDVGEVELATRQKRIFIEQIFHLEECGQLTLQDIVDETHSMILVSFETVSNTIIIALLNLAMDTACQAKLRQELLEVSDGRVAVDAKDLQQMEYLDMILNESLRLLTTVPMNLRHVSKEFPLRAQRKKATALRNVLIPKDTIIVLDTFNMQRDPQYWGERSQQFNPEHFGAQVAGETAIGRRRQEHPYAFVPFSKGLRSCIGWRYSIYLTKIILAKLISSFEFRTETKLQDLRFVEGISLKFQNADTINFQITKVKR